MHFESEGNIHFWTGKHCLLCFNMLFVFVHVLFVLVTRTSIRVVHLFFVLFLCCYCWLLVFLFVVIRILLSFVVWFLKCT